MNPLRRSTRTDSALPIRRRRRSLGALGALLALSLAASACSSAVSEANGTGSSGVADTDAVLRIASTTDIVPATFFTNSTEVSNTLIGNVYDSLVDYDLDSLTPKPRLATSWTFSPDGKQLTLELRDDVTFHDGRPFTSADVEFSLKTYADPQWNVQFLRTAKAITAYDTTDPHAITLTFAHPLSNIFDVLDVLPIIDSGSFDQLKTGKAYNGTGPFTFESWTPGSKLVLKRNEKYWGTAPKLAEVQVSIVSDATAQVAQLRAKQVDVATGASFRDSASLAKDPAYTVHRFDGAENEIYVGSDLTVPALADVRVRRAVAYALDRERIVKEVYQGVGRPANLPWAENSPAYDKAQDTTYGYDPAKAKALVAQVGAVPTIPLSFPAGNATYEAVAQIVQGDLKAVGITVELKPVEYADFITQLIGGTFDGFWILQHNYAQFTPSTLMVSAFPFNADKNASHFDSPEYKAAAATAWELPNGTDATAQKAYRRLNQILLDNLWLAEIAVIPPQIPTTAKVSGLNLTKRNELDLRTTSVEQ